MRLRTGQEPGQYVPPPDSGGGLGLGMPGGLLNTPELADELARERAEADAAKARLTDWDIWGPRDTDPYAAPPPLEAVKRALDTAPLGSMVIGGAAALALGWAGSSGWMRFLRGLGTATLVASGVIAARRALLSTGV